MERQRRREALVRRLEPIAPTMLHRILFAALLTLSIAACATTAAPPDDAADVSSTAPAPPPHRNEVGDALGVAGAVAKSILSLFSFVVVVP